MHLKCKDWTRFGRKHRMQKCPNGQVITIFARSLKPRIFLTSAKGDQQKFFKNFPKTRPRLKGPKAHLRKWHYPLNSMHLKGKNWRSKRRLQKFPNDQVMQFWQGHPKPAFSGKVQRGDQGKFLKNRPKRCPR